MLRRDNLNPSPPIPPSWIGFSPRPAKSGGFFSYRSGLAPAGLHHAVMPLPLLLCAIEVPGFIGISGW